MPKVWDSRPSSSSQVRRSSIPNSAASFTPSFRKALPKRPEQPGIFGPASPLRTIRGYNHQASVAWFYRQILALADGRPLDIAHQQLGHVAHLDIVAAAPGQAAQVEQAAEVAPDQHVGAAGQGIVELVTGHAQGL